MVTQTGNPNNSLVVVDKPPIPTSRKFYFAFYQQPVPSKAAVLFLPSDRDPERATCFFSGARALIGGQPMFYGYQRAYRGEAAAHKECIITKNGNVVAAIYNLEDAVEYMEKLIEEDVWVPFGIKESPSGGVNNGYGTILYEIFCETWGRVVEATLLFNAKQDFVSRQAILMPDSTHAQRTRDSLSLAKKKSSSQC